jgi:hypothetical protein
MEARCEVDGKTLRVSAQSKFTQFNLDVPLFSESCFFAERNVR